MASLHMSPITDNQWKKVVKAMLYSFFSGFVGALILSFGGLLQSGQPIEKKVLVSLVIAAVGGGLNTLAVTVKQLFTPAGK